MSDYDDWKCRSPDDERDRIAAMREYDRACYDAELEVAEIVRALRGMSCVVVDDYSPVVDTREGGNRLELTVRFDLEPDDARYELAVLCELIASRLRVAK